MAFGLRSAPNIFNTIADFLAWVLLRSGIPYVLHYLDGFLIMAPLGLGLASSLRPQVEALLDYMGAPIAHHKTEGPSSVLTFLGIQIDTDLFQMSLPLDKVQRLRDLLFQWRHWRTCTKKELQVYLGHLSHAASVVRPG